MTWDTIFSFLKPDRAVSNLKVNLIKQSGTGSIPPPLRAEHFLLQQGTLPQQTQLSENLSGLIFAFAPPLHMALGYTFLSFP